MDLILCACYTHQFCSTVGSSEESCSSSTHSFLPSGDDLQKQCRPSLSVQAVLSFSFCVDTGKWMERTTKNWAVTAGFVPWSLCKHSCQISALIVRSHCLMGCPQSTRLTQGHGAPPRPPGQVWSTCTRVQRAIFSISPLSHKFKPVVFAKQRVVIYSAPSPGSIQIWTNVITSTLHLKNWKHLELKTKPFFLKFPLFCVLLCL